MPNLSSFEQKVLASVDAGEMWQTVEGLSHIERISGQAGEYESVDWLVKKLTEYGVPHEVLEFDAYLSFPIRASLRVLGPVEKEFRAKTRAFGASSPAEGLDGELVFVPSKVAGIGFQSAQENQYEGYDVRGKIVLSPRGGPDGVYDAMRAGAIAHIHYWPSSEDAIHEMISTTVWGTPTPESAERIPTIPSISVNNENGAYLRELCQAGPVRVRLNARTETRWCRERMPVATIPAAGNPDEYFLVGGHLDSWYAGITDNATGDAAMLELARVLNEHRGELKRSVKIGWWVGHSYGRYAGSTWYCDTFFNDLRRNCVGYMDIDSPGVKGATIYDEITCMMENWHLAEGAIRDVAGVPAGRERPPRAGDYSFYGPGLPSMFMLMGNRPKDQRFAVGGSGLGWWWHTEYDTIEWADPAVLAQDTRIYALAILRVIQSLVLPYRHTPVAEEIKAALDDIDGEVSGRFDFAPVFQALAALKSAAEAGDAALGAIPAERAAAANRQILKVLRALIPINYTRCGEYDHDPAMEQPILPLMDDARKLAKLDPEGNDYRFLLNRLVRSRNHVVHAIETATEALNAVAAARG
jgi:N-acetylated-alpha-linked acidic dipeptidase